MQIRVLGPLEASVDDRPLALGGAKQRAVLAMLGLEANRAVTADRLIEGLWGDEPPSSAAKMVQNYVWRLRKLLDDDAGGVIITRGRAYELRIDREQVDACRLERLVSEAAHAAGNGENGNAARAALALFRGEPLADIADEPFAAPEIRRLEELRLTAAELAIDADLAAGRHHEIVGEIDALLADNPLRERLHAQRMLALYRCGRQAEALEAYRHARRTLVDEIGVEPSPDLRRLHDAILRQDAALDVEPASAELRRELDAAAAPPLIGRDGELAALRERWQRAAVGTGSLITLVGAYGMGKTRLAAELAGEAHREGASVLYAAGTGPPEAALAAIARTRETRRPALLVIDDADRAPGDVRTALRDLDLTALPALVLATGQEAAALARLEPRETIVLEPLAARGVQEIAGFYAPAGSAAVPVETLLATSRGVPRRIHEAASEWARREATRRVDAAADRAEAGRTEARAMVDELAGSVVELQSTRERAAGYDAGDDRVVCPYKGLAPFDADDADYFFGRERLVAELVARLVGAPLLGVVGPSGSGKSSVVRAGLLPALAGGVLPGSHNWTQALIRPGEHPATQLRRATRRLARERRAVLAIDQFEELFTACDDEGERTEFIGGLMRAARSGTIVVLAVRADFYGRCGAYPELSDMLGANNVLVGPMSRDELGRAIERPAERVGLSVEPELVEALLSDVEGQPGALPLLSTALLELWRGRDRRQLRLAAYARSGGVQGAVARLAEDAYVHLDPAQQEVARRLLLGLTDEEGGALVRRRIALAELEPEIAEVASRLADRRLLTIDDGSVEVAHEALLREWPRLRAWLDEDVQGRRLHRQLADAARAWDTDARDPGGLYRGGRLASALDWAAGHAGELTTTERAFLDDSRRASGRAQRRLRIVLAALASLLVVAIGAGLVALDQRGRARDQATAAAAQRLGAEALADEGIDRSLLLARQGVMLRDSLETQGNLFATLLRSPAAIGVLSGDGSRVTGLDLSPDGRTVAFVNSDGTLNRIDTSSRRPSVDPSTVSGHLDWGPDDVRYSADGTRLAVGGTEPQIFDARTQRVISRVRASGTTYGLRFAPDAQTLFAVVDARGRSSLQRFDVNSGAPLGVPKLVAPGFKSVTLMPTLDGRRLVTAFEGGPVAVRDARTFRSLQEFKVPAMAAALSRDDRTLVAGGRDGSVRFLDLATGSTRKASGRHDGAVTAAAFSADGRTAVTAGEDNTAIVWDVDRAAAAETLEGHSGVIMGVAISSDGRRAYTAALDGKVVVWDIAGDRRLGRRFDLGPARPAALQAPPIASHALSPDGEVLAAGHGDGTVTLFDAHMLSKRSTFRAVPRGPVLGMGYLPGGRLLAVGGENGFLGLFDPSRGELVKRLRGHDGHPVVEVRFSRDGRLMATVSPNEVLLWTLRRGEPVGAPRRYSSGTWGMSPTAVSPDGRTLALASYVGVQIVDVPTLQPKANLPPPAAGAFGVGFTSDGRYLGVGRSDGATELWSTETWQRAPGELAGHNAEVLSLVSSPDGRRLATGGMDGTIRLFDVETRKLLGAPLRAVPNRVVEPEFTPDGAYLFAITDAGVAYRWDVRPSSWARQACAIAGRRLTREEWADVLPERDYDPAC